MLVGTGELVEQCRLATVLITCQRKPDRLILGYRIPELMLFPVIRIAKLSHTRMFCCDPVPLPVLCVRMCCGLCRFHLNLICFCQTQRQFVATQFNLDGISHRCHLAQGHDRARGQPHIKQMMAKCPFSVDL